MAPFGLGKAAIVAVAALLLTGCDEKGQFKPFASRNADEPGGETTSGSTRLVERDTEAPEVFQVTEPGLWDGRPSLGGVWVAHPDVKDPERVIVRNQTNDKFVIGALFRRERDNPGPKLQVSSDAASALGLLAGQPTELNVTALRREEITEAPDAGTGTESGLTSPEEVAAAPLDGADDTLASAAAAIDAAEDSLASGPAPAPAPVPQQRSSLDQPFIQIGLFSVETNANNTAEMMRKAGMIPNVEKLSSSGKTFWRVTVGPARNATERAALLKQVKAQGFQDAYFVSN